MRTVFAPQRFHTGLRTLLVVLALLNHAVAASAHDHEGLRGAQDNLCAICVYGVGAGAAVDTGGCASSPAVVHAAPEAAKVSGQITRLTAYTSIRAPPRHL